MDTITMAKFDLENLFEMINLKLEINLVIQEHYLKLFAK